MIKLTTIYLLLTTILVFGGCATKSQLVTLTKTDDGLVYEQAEAGIFEAEILPDGTIKVKSDSKKEGWKLFEIGNLIPKYEEND